MKRIAAGLVSALALTLASDANAAFQTTPDALTPEGAATLASPWLGPATAEGYLYPRVLTAVKVTVGEGSRADTVRFHVASSEDPSLGTQGSPAYTLPAAPGTYAFAMPHQHVDYRSIRIAIEQRAGGLAIVKHNACDSSQGTYADPCELVKLNAYPTPPPDLYHPGTPATVAPGDQLAIDPVYEEDRDGDHLGDATEDHTDLKLSLVEVRDAGALVQLTNAGPLPADMPTLVAAPTGAVATGKDSACKTQRPGRFPFGDPPNATSCYLDPIAVGESRRFLVPFAPGATGPVGIVLKAEGSDLVPADNAVTVTPLPAMAVTASTTARQRFARGIAVRVTSARTGRAKVSAAVRVNGRTLRFSATTKVVAGKATTLTLRAKGATLRSLRRALARRGTLRATVTIRTTPDTGAPSVTTKKVTIVR